MSRRNIQEVVRWVHLRAVVHQILHSKCLINMIWLEEDIWSIRRNIRIKNIRRTRKKNKTRKKDKKEHKDKKSKDHKDKKPNDHKDEKVKKEKKEKRIKSIRKINLKKIKITQTLSQISNQHLFTLLYFHSVSTSFILIYN